VIVEKDSGKFVKCEGCKEMNATVANPGNAGATAGSFTRGGGASSTEANAGCNMAGGTPRETLKAGHHPVKCHRDSSVTKCHTCNWFRVIFICASRNDTAGINKTAL
jgi:hypothetical protein